MQRRNETRKKPNRNRDGGSVNFDFINSDFGTLPTKHSKTGI
jgi:hypothetical protein